MAEQGVDFGLATDELLSVLHRIAIAQTVPDVVDPELGDAERIVALAGQMSAEDVQLFYELAQAGRARFVEAADPGQAFEMLVLRLMAFRPVAVLDPALGPDDVEALAPAAGEGGAEAKKPEPPPAAAVVDHSAAAPLSGPATVPASEGHRDASRESPVWHEVLAGLKLTGSARNVASHCVLVHFDETRWELLLDQNRASLFNDRHQALISQALEEHLGRELRVDIRPGNVEGETPAARELRLAAERLAAAEASIAGDPRVRALLSDFEGELVAGSVRVDEQRDQSS
jgi:DNA polymerase-3 subunit gamma/tau